jgi:dienelactone hydrolase
MQSTFTRLAIALIVTLIIPITLFGQTENDALPRRAFFGVVLGSNDSGAVIATSTVEGSTAASAGIRAGDVLETIEDTAIRKPADVIAALGKKSAGSEINIHLSRAGAPQSLSAVLKSFPAERMEHAKVEYGSVAVEGHRLRTIVSVPDGDQKRFPAVMLIQGGSCGSIDAPIGPWVAQPGLVREIGNQGFVTMRVEKSGVGDSEGPPCSTIGYQQELAGYQAALRALMAHPAVDKNRVFLLGISLGGVFSPVLASENHLAGVVVFGTLAGPPPPYPGRSKRFFEEFAKVDIPAAWRAVDAPVLILHGEYDEVTNEADHVAIETAVNGAHPGLAKHLELDQLDHCWTRHASRERSLNNCGGGEATTALRDTVLEFLRAHS